MTDTAAPAPASATPAPGSTSGTPAPKTMGTSAVNATAAASAANQQALAAGEQLGMSAKDGQPAAAAPGTQPQSAPATAEPASLTTTPSFTPTGNATIDQISTLLTNKNFAGSQAIVNEVISTHELSLSSKAQLVDAMGGDVAELVISTLERSVQDVKEAGRVEGARLKEYAFGKLGGDNADTTWARLQQHAQADTSMTTEHKSIMNELLGLGGLKAEMAIDTLISKYTNSSNFRKEPNLMAGDQSTQDGFNHLSKQGYQAEIGPAVNKYGENSQEVKALRHRRQISISRGYN